ncbi:MAG: hypothetical protein CSA62_11950 [Planctomycetota bacterium]|nr:MAG: hypothetical protein CSA62_11950 [Planctomycetota bacterium]
MKSTAFALALLLTAAAPAIGQDSSKESLLIRAGTVHVGNGQVLHKVLIAVQGGKITKIASDDPAKPNDSFGAQKLLDLRGRSIVPGFVAAFSERVAKNGSYNLSPDIRAGENYELLKNDDKLIKSGITTLYLSPGKQRLMPGIGSVVKTGGTSPESRLLRMDAALVLTLNASSRNQIPSVYEPVMSPTSDNPLKPARRQLGSTRASQIDVLEAAFAEARDTRLVYGGLGPAEQRYRLAPLRAAMAGKLPVRLRASTAADIVHGLDFAKRLGLKVILELPKEADRVAKRLATGSIPVVTPMALRLGRTLEGDYDPEDPRLRLASPTQAGKLARAGVPVVLAPSDEEDLPSLRMLAGLASRFGMPRSKALAAISSEAAKALGVDQRVGSIEVGKDADMVVLTGSPFDARSRITRVLIDGKTVHESKEQASTYAIRVGRLLRGDGSEEKNALIVVKNGRIYDAGSHAALPPGCSLYEAPRAVLTPGFIDASSKLGLHLDATVGLAGRPATIKAKSDIDVAKALEAEDASFELARKAGVTSVFVTPDSGGPLGPRVAAVHTSGDAEHFYVRELAGLRMTVTRGGAAGEKQILAAIAGAKKYFAAKNAPAKPLVKKEKASQQKQPSKAADPISGNWSGKLIGPAPHPLPVQVTLELKGSHVSGKFRIPLLPSPVPIQGSWKPPTLSFTATVPNAGKLTFTAKVSGKTMSGKVTGGPGKASFELTKQDASSKAAPSAKPATKTQPKKKLNHALEPFGPVLRREIPLVVHFNGRAAAQAAINAIVVKSKLRLVLSASSISGWVEIAKQPLQLPSGCRIGLLFTVEDILYRKGKIQVMLPQYLAEQKHANAGFDPILVSRAQTGTMLLPTHAAWAVAGGLDPRLALRMLSSNPARHFGVDSEIGSLEFGKSADFVLLDGDPFDLQSRVLGVWIHGKQKTGTWQDIRAALEELK